MQRTAEEREAWDITYLTRTQTYSLSHVPNTAMICITNVRVQFPKWNPVVGGAPESSAKVSLAQKHQNCKTWESRERS